MSSKRNAILALAGMLSLAASAHAGVIVTATPQGIPTDNQVPPDIAPGYIGYLLSLATTDGSNITAIDFSPANDTGNIKHGLFGPFLQLSIVGFGGNTPTPEESSTNIPAGQFSTDSHFLSLPAGAELSAFPATEDNNLQHPAGAPANTSQIQYGTGSFMYDAYGIAGASQSSTLPLAYVVLPVGSTATYSGAVATDNGTFEVSGTVPVPEPASLGILAGAVCLDLRRRRA